MTDLAVIMSIYHNDKLEYVKQSVQSILTQTYSYFIFFIALDGPVSTEIKTYVTNIEDSRVKLYKIEENGGLARALNFLLEIVLKNPEYKFIARMDADDISLPKRFENQHNFLLANSEISCIGTWYQEIDESDNYLSNQKLPVTHDEIKKFFLKRSPLAHPSVVFRREMIEKAGFYPTDTFKQEDSVFWSNALNKGLIFANIPEILIKFRIDRNFYRRRSGIKFGFYYIKSRFRINKVLKAPFYIYLSSFGFGLVRMMPSIFLRWFYKKFREQ